MESFCSAGRRESSTWALLVRPIELIGHRFQGSDWASTTWALRYRGMLRVCARAAASDEMSGLIPASTTTFRAATFWHGNVSHRRRALAHGCARSRSTLGVGCVCTQPTTAFKPKTLYYLIFPTHHSLLQNETTEHQILYTAVFS